MKEYRNRKSDTKPRGQRRAADAPSDAAGWPVHKSDMHYYEVAVASSRYHGSEHLTYHSEEELKPGAIVLVPMRDQTALGIVLDKTTKPKGYATKQILKPFTDQLLPKALLELLAWLKAYYPAPLGIITQQFVPSFLLAAQSPTDEATLPASGKKVKLPPLTSEQSKVLKSIRASSASTFLLHGETGSGKTRIYTELAKESLESGRSVLILTPEISLTPQLVNTFRDSFGNQCIVTHSNLTDKQRRLAWQTIAKTKPLVVIGPRSALFSPLKNIGLLVVDEAHEGAYKHEQLPHYQAVRVASALAKIHSSLLVLGSATPAVTDYFIATAKNTPLLRMTKQAAASTNLAPKNVDIISLRDKTAFSQHPFISNTLIKAIQRALANKEQALIFINRRGSARLTLCQNCGWQAACPQCDIPLVYHADKHELRCHTCGHKEAALTQCPVCQSSDIIFKGIGTKTLEASLLKLFPRARIKRFDTDNLKIERLENQYANVISGEVDILVGTQLLTKGLDLPKLSIVGIIWADASLSFPDYTAGERTYQMLSQVIGRVGRGHRHGHVILQTYNPENPLLIAAANARWQGFLEEELKQRQTFNFPPFVHLLKLQTTRSKPALAEKAGQDLVGHLQKLGLKIEAVGPSPAFKEKRGNKYCWQVVVKSKTRQNLIEVIKNLPAGWSYNLDPTDLL